MSKTSFTASTSPVTHLQRRQTFSLHGKPGQQLAVCSGAVWVTQDGDPRDLVLEARQSFTLDRAGHVLVSALKDASFSVRTRPHPVRVAVKSAEVSAVPAGATTGAAAAAACY